MKEKIKIISKQELLKIINQEIIAYGNGCDLNHIDISYLKDLSSIFENSSFNGNISQWDTSQVTNMSFMFFKSQFNNDISKWNTSNITNMSYMFSNSPFNGDISSWNTNKVTDMSVMFSGSKFNSNISNWNVEKVENMSFLFLKSLFNEDFSNWKPYSLNTSINIGFESQSPYWADKDNNKSLCEAINNYVEKKALKDKLENKFLQKNINTRKNKI